MCTIGPSSWDTTVMKAMIDAGMNVARINGAFADVPELKRVADIVRSISPSVALMLDIKGHEVRLNKFDEDMPIKPGDEVVLGSTTDAALYPRTYMDLHEDIAAGQRIYVDKGEAELEVTKIEDGNIHTKVISGKVIKGGKGMNFPGAKLTNEPITKRDIEQMKFAVEDDWDFISASFIRNAHDIQAVKDAIGKTPIKIIAKIEDQQGVDNFEEILEISDGIMIARGDMGSEMPIERLPIIQKEMIYLCNQAGKPVITATNMLESMIEKVFPTRAEITDVANAVLDGTDAIMTSGETTTGKHPLIVVETMSKIAVENEQYIVPEIMEPYLLEHEEVSVAISNATYEIVQNLEVDKILVVSQTGNMARIIARHSLPIPVVAFVSEEVYKRQLALTKGVEPHTFPREYTDRDGAINGLIEYATTEGMVTKSERVLIVGKASKAQTYFPNIFEYVDLKKYFSSQK